MASVEEVAAAVAPLTERKVKSDPPAEPQDEPVLEIRPCAEKVAQPAEPMVLETMRLVLVAVPDTVSPPVTVPSPIVEDASE